MKLLSKSQKHFHLFTNFHYHHITKLFQLKDKLGLLYEHLIIQAFAISLVSIFIPVYLLSIGFSLQKVLVFLLIEWGIFGALSPVYGRIINRFGLKEVILIRTPLYFVGLYFLFLLRDNIFLREVFYFIPAIIGASGALYTLSIDSIFASEVGNRKQGEKVAKLIALPQLATIVGPFMGGMLSALWGFQILFFAVFILLFISCIPILLIKEHINHPPFKLKIFKKMKGQFKNFLYIVPFGTKTLIEISIIPLVIYLYQENTIYLGSIVSILSIISGLYVLLIGKLTDKYGYAKILRFGGAVTCIIYLTFGYFLQNDSSPFLLFPIAAAMICFLINLPFETYLFKESRKEKSPLEFLAFREFAQFWGRMILLGTLILFNYNLDFAFYLGGFFSGIFILF